MLSNIQLANLAVAVAAAVASEKTTKLPAELTVPQWADESSWGEQAPDNNCFGIMEANPSGESLVSFPTLQACFDRHAELVTSAAPHAAAWARFQKDGDKAMLMQRIAHSYRADPLYATKLAQTLQMPEVRGAIAEARKPLVNITK